MRTYYRGADAVVTGEMFAWRTGDSGQTFVIAELSNVVIAIDRKRRWRMFGLGQPLFTLAATYRHERVCLYATHDERVFNQVRRALRRAIEDLRPRRP